MRLPVRQTRAARPAARPPDPDIISAMKRWRTHPRLSHLEVVHPDGQVDAVPWRHIDADLRVAKPARALYPRLRGRQLTCHPDLVQAARRLSTRDIAMRLRDGRFERTYPCPAGWVYVLVVTTLAAAVLTWLVINLPNRYKELLATEADFPASTLLSAMAWALVGGIALVTLLMVAIVPLAALWPYWRAMRFGRGIVAVRIDSRGTTLVDARGRERLFAWRDLTESSALELRFRTTDGPQTVRFHPYSAPDRAFMDALRRTYPSVAGQTDLPLGVRLRCILYVVVGAALVVGAYAGLMRAVDAPISRTDGLVGGASILLVAAILSAYLAAAAWFQRRIQPPKKIRVRRHGSRRRTL